MLIISKHNKRTKLTTTTSKRQHIKKKVLFDIVNTHVAVAGSLALFCDRRRPRGPDPGLGHHFSTFVRPRCEKSDKNDVDPRDATVQLSEWKRATPRANSAQ